MLKINNNGTNQEGKFEGIDKITSIFSSDIKDELTQILSVPNVKLTLNLENIKYIDSSGIGVLISAMKTARQNSNIFLLSNINKDIMNLFIMMKLDNVFDFA